MTITIEDWAKKCLETRETQKNADRVLPLPLPGCGPCNWKPWPRIAYLDLTGLVGMLRILQDNRQITDNDRQQPKTDNRQPTTDNQQVWGQELNFPPAAGFPGPTRRFGPCFDLQCQTPRLPLWEQQQAVPYHVLVGTSGDLGIAAWRWTRARGHNTCGQGQRHGSGGR